MACYSGVSTLQLHGTALLESAQLSHPVHLVLDALWGFTELPRPALVVTGCPSPHYLRDLLALALGVSRRTVYNWVSSLGEKLGAGYAVLLRYAPVLPAVARQVSFY